MVAVPGGTVSLADPANPGVSREVRLPAFWIGRTELTWDAYDVFAYRLDLPEEQREGADASSRPSKPYGAPDRGFGHQGHPVISVSYHAAEQFCRWLSAKTGKRYRLPTEAEWEYACRAGQPAGMRPTPELLERHAWYWENGDDRTHPASTKEPNAWGLNDMLGNAAEWCQGRDGVPVVRGGSYNDKAEKIHCGAREQQTPAWQATDPQNPKSRWWLTDGPFVGFRVVREE
jgi:formylglycine-generating enzyme required for sulfatase activity